MIPVLGRMSAYFFSALLIAAAHGQSYDLVLNGGRVMDPESGLDAVRNVGIRGGRIEAVSESVLSGEQVVDVSGHVVAPGFIDLHAHGQDLFSARLQAQDGVTTGLELETGVYPVAKWYASKEGKAVINYGATVGHIPVRIAVKHGLETGHYTGNEAARRELAKTDGEWAYENANEDELDDIARRVEEGLDEGALGIGFGIQYTPGARREEIARLFRVAAGRDATAFVHMRYIGDVEPGSSTAAVQEVLGNVAATGASLHIVHIGSSGLNRLHECLAMIEGARANGLDVTTEVYPYTAASTNLKSAIFDSGWQERLGMSFGDIEWVATGERLTEETFNKYRGNGGWIVMHMMNSELIESAVAAPGVIIASDGVPFVNGRAHPRGAGTYARVLGHYVRERKALPLMEALRKMTLLPAQRLEAYADAMKRKGRLQAGTDADITVFDPAEIQDRATFSEPAQGSAGIPHVIVGGTFVVRDGQLLEDAFPGKAISARN